MSPSNPGALWLLPLLLLAPSAERGPSEACGLADRLQDQDGDGLDDALEAGQSSSAERVDTDGDGWNDAEELARGSLATAACSQPGDEPLSIGSSAYVRGGRLHAAFALHLASGTLANAELTLGIFARGKWTVLEPASYAQHATLTSVPSHDPGDLALVLDVAVPDVPLRRAGHMSIFAVLREGQLACATAVNLRLSSGTPVALISPSQLAPGALEQLGPGLLHRPLGGSTRSTQWSAGETCFQRVDTVGTHGAVVTQEVTSSSCVSGWDGYCDGGACASAVGATLDLVDPAALIGG